MGTMDEAVLKRHLEGVRRALGRTNGEPLDDVWEALSTGDAQVWVEPDALILTEIIQEPHRRVLHVWVATGDLETILGSVWPRVQEWAVGQGCEYATLSGRRGWERVLKDDGWAFNHVVMGRRLGGDEQEE